MRPPSAFRLLSLFGLRPKSRPHPTFGPASERLYPLRLALGLCAAALLSPLAAAAAPLVGTNGADGTSIGLNDTPTFTSTTTGLNATVTNLTTMAGINTGDQIAVTANGVTSFVTIYAGDTLQDLATKLSAITGVRATVTLTGTNDTITITPENVNTSISLNNVTGTPISATGVGFAGFPGTVAAVSTPGGDGADGGAGILTSSLTAGFGLGSSADVTGGAGGDGGTTAYNLTATDGGDAGDGGDGLRISNTSFTSVDLAATTSKLTGGAGGVGGDGSGGGDDGADGDGGIGIHATNAAIPAVTITNRGTISGGLSGDGTTRNYAIYMANSGNTLRMFSGSALIGDVYLGTANGTLELDGSGSEDANFSGVGALSLTKGSNWTLSGNVNPTAGGISIATAGTSTLTATGTLNGTMLTKSGTGTLVVNGTAGAITLNAGTLKGAGTIGNLTVNSGGRIAPGNSIGTLNVAGNTGFAAGSIYEVEVNNAGNADLIAATGSVTLDTGASVNVTAENGTDTGATYAASTTYTIITAGGGVTGTFGSVTENFAFLDAALGYGAKSVTLTLNRNATGFASAAETANQRAVASSAGALGTGNAVHDSLVTLSTADARSAFDSLSGEIYASANTLLIQQSRYSRDAMGAHLRATFDSLAALKRPGSAPQGAGDAQVIPSAPLVWTVSYGGWGWTDSTGNTAAMNNKDGGVFIGADTEAFGGWRAGLMAGFGNSGFNIRDRSSSGSANSYTLGAYAGSQNGPLGMRFGTSYVLHDVNVARQVRSGSLSNSLRASYFASTTQIFGEAGYTLVTPLARLEPFAGAALIYQKYDGFSETGGTTALSPAASGQAVGMTTLGLRAQREFAGANELTAALTGSLAWRRTITDTKARANMRFATGNSFAIDGAPLDTDTALIEAGVRLDFSPTASLDMSYGAGFGSQTQSQGFSLSFAGQF